MADQNKPVEAKPAEPEMNLEEMKKKFKPKKKQALPMDMLETANTYDDKVVMVKLLTEKEQGRVVLMVKNMLKAK